MTELLIWGLDSEPSQNFIEPKRTMCAVSFKLLAIEYLLGVQISPFLNKGTDLASDFWYVTANDLCDFDSFCNKVTAKMVSLLTDQDVDTRKQKLFEALYASNGSLTVKELSEQCYWSSRQINRYFNQQFCISVKKNCKILRFRTSFQHIKEGSFFLNRTSLTDPILSGM